MNIQKIKKYAFALTLTFGFVAAPALSNFSTAQAQIWGYGQNRRDNRWEERQERERERIQHLR